MDLNVFLEAKLKITTSSLAPNIPIILLGFIEFIYSQFNYRLTL